MTESHQFKVVIAGSGFEDDAPEREQLGDIADVVHAEGEALLAEVADADAILVDAATIDDEVLAAASKLKVVAGYGVGVDQIEVDAAARRGVAVCNSPEGMSTEVAEHAIGLLFALARQLTFFDVEVRQRHVWDGFSKAYRPVVLRGKNLGIVGFGRTGIRSAGIAAGIGMNLLVFDPFIDPDALDIPTAWNIRFCASLEEVLSEADAVTLHVPLTDGTKNMMNAETLAKFKRGSLLVNVSRGGVVDQEALCDALRSGQLTAAALDVFVPEPPTWNEPLLELPNLILTPHMAWRSEKSGRQMQSDASGEVRRILLGETPRWRIV